MLNFENVLSEPLTKEYILSKVSEEDIISFCINQSIILNRPILSPLRIERNPSFTFKYINNKPIWKDWGTGKSGDCFTLVMEKYNCNYNEALNIIYVNLLKGRLNIDIKSVFNEIDFRSKEKLTNEFNEIKVITKPFTDTDYRYWNLYNLDLNTLLKFDVNACKKAYYKYNDIWYLIGEYSNLNPMYCYKVRNKKYKIYFPLASKSKKWKTNTSTDDIQGYKMLPDNGDTVILTKSLKDVMCLYKMNISAISLNSESCSLNSKIYNKLTNRFKNIYILYDNDEQGIKGSNKIIINYCNIKQIFVPLQFKSKDVSELIKNIGFKEAEKEVIKLL